MICEDRVSVKKHRIARKRSQKRNEGYGKGTVKKIVGLTLIVLAEVFGGVLVSMPAWAAFGTVFTYISVQLGIWMA